MTSPTESLHGSIGSDISLPNAYQMLPLSINGAETNLVKESQRTTRITTFSKHHHSSPLSLDVATVHRVALLGPIDKLVIFNVAVAMS